MTAAQSVGPYLPRPDLDRDLAELGYAAVRGWPDQRPITASLVRSRLRTAPGAPATLLAVHRNRTGRLIAAAALRWPGGPGGIGRLWGPVVHPDHQGAGLGRSVFDLLAGTLAAYPKARIATAEIPDARQRAAEFFTRAGWHPVPGATLFKRDLPIGNNGTPRTNRVRTLLPDERLDRKLADLVVTNNPPLAGPIADHTFDRWKADERFNHSCVSLIEDERGLVGVTLVYPLVHTDDTEATEALVGDVLIRPDVPIRPDVTERRVGIGTELVLTALGGAMRCGATVARAVVLASDQTALQCLDALDFRPTSVLRYFQAPKEQPCSKV